MEELSGCSTSQVKLVWSCRLRINITYNCCKSTVVCTSHIFSRQCRRRNGLQTAKAEKLHCLFAMRYDASEKAKLLARPPHVCHMSGRCQNNSQHAPCASGECQRDLSTSLSKPTCRDEVAGCACKCITRKSTVPASASHASQPKRTDTSWPSSSSSSSECGKSSGDTKPVPAKHCLETCLIQALQCVSRTLVEHS